MKTYIENVVSTLTDSQITNLNNAIYTNTISIHSKLSDLTKENKGIYRCEIKLNWWSAYQVGILIFTNSSCTFLQWNDGKEIYVFEIAFNSKKITKRESIKIEALKRLASVGAGGSESEWEKSIKDYLIYDSENNEIQCGVHFYCDGDLETDLDVDIGRDLLVDNLNNIQDKNGDPLIPNPVNADLGKFLKVGTTGIMWSNLNVPEIIIKAKSIFEGEGFVYETHKIYVVYNDSEGEHNGECYVRYYTH